MIVLSCERFRPHLLQRMAVLYSLTFGDHLLREPLKGYPVSFVCDVSRYIKYIHKYKIVLYAWLKYYSN